MGNRNYVNNGSFKSMPRPISLDFPEPRRAPSGPKQREIRSFPRFEEDGYGGVSRERPRPNNYNDGYRAYEPPVRERPRQNYRAPRDEMQRRRRPSAPPPRKRPAPVRQESPIRQGLLALSGINFSFKVPPIVRHIAIMVTGLATIIAVSIILITNAVADNALAVFVDGEHVGYIELTAGWNSEAFHEEAVIALQSRRSGVVSVSETVTLEPARAPQGAIYSRNEMLVQIANNHFSYNLTAIAIYAYNPLYQRFFREAIMRSYADVQATKYLLTARFRTANTVDIYFDPDWMLVRIEIVDDNVVFTTPQEAFSRLDRRVRQNLVYVIQSGDTLHGIARAWDMEFTELLRINNITDVRQDIFPGERLNVFVQAPLLNVMIIEETSQVQTIPREVERVYVDTLPPAQTNVRQEGSDGEGTVITRTKLRGITVIEYEEIIGDVITPPVPMIVEVGEAR